MSILKHLKNAPTCFDHHSDHLQGAQKSLILKFVKNVESQCGDAAA